MVGLRYTLCDGDRDKVCDAGNSEVVIWEERICAQPLLMVWF